MMTKQAAAIVSGSVLAVVLTGVVLLSGNAADEAVLVYKTPTCGCCQKWVDHLDEAGFDVEVRNLTSLGAIKNELGVPRQLASCHTAVVDGYVIEGHVPAVHVQRILAERPAIKGIAVAGMPIGSPGMEGPNPQAYDIVAFDAEGSTSLFAQESPGASR